MSRSGLAGVVLTAAGLTVSAQQAPVPTFRGGVDVVGVDVQVSGKDGRPVTGLGPEAFDVTIEGHASPVVSVQFVDYTQDSATDAPLPITPLELGSSAPPPAPRPVPRGRVILLAIDCMSFGVDLSRGVVTAATMFVNKLNPNDLVGVFSYPLGPKIDPTTDHTAVLKGLSQIVGERDSSTASGFALTPSDVVDLSLGAGPAAQLCGGDGSCMKRLEDEAKEEAASYEAQGTASLGMLRNVIHALGGVEGQKILVLASAGLVSSDRPGGRPDLSTAGIDIGREAAGADVTVYTLFLDQSWLEMNAAETRHGRRGAVTNYARDSAILGRWLDQFSGEAGGALMSVLAGNGDFAYDRILAETSGYYELAVRAPDRDRDGRVHPIKIKVNAPAAAVRARAWVMIPKG